MKKTVSILLMVAIISICTNISAHMDVKVTLDRNEISFPDAKPFIDERDRVLVPIRFVSPPSKNGHRKATKNGMNRSHSFVFLKTSAFIPRFT